MSTIQFYNISDIKVKVDRFRQTYTDRNLSNLQESISTGLGLINPITLRKDKSLITGASRLRAITVLHSIKIPVYFNGTLVPLDTIPAIILDTEREEIEYLESELNENIHREDFTYIEQAQAIARIATLKEAISSDIPIEDVEGISKESIKLTAEELYDGKSGSYYDEDIKASIKIATIIEKDKDSELSKTLLKAKNKKEGKKILKSHNQNELRAKLALKEGSRFSSKSHKILLGDCREKLKELPDNSFDVCLTDPMYGISAHKFGDNDARYSNYVHNYDDSFVNFTNVMTESLIQLSRVMKEAAHVYLACDIRNYYELAAMLIDADIDWQVPNAPFIQYKIGGGRIPIPGFTPRRSYELWLYAYRGGKQEYKIINDVIPCSADKGDVIPSQGAKKPQELLKIFLSRSCMPGDKVLDFMAGSGGTIRACHELKLSCTAIELNVTSYGECLEVAKRLK